MIFDAETGLPIKQECAPDILHDLQLIRREENEHPGTLQELHPRDITAAWNRLAEYRTIVTSPVSADEARDRAIEKDGIARSIAGYLLYPGEEDFRCCL